MCKDYWHREKNEGIGAFFLKIISLESQQKCQHQHFSSKKEGKDIYSQIRIRLFVQKTKYINKVVKTTWWKVT